jgi:hypothetical protein
MAVIPLAPFPILARSLIPLHNKKSYVIKDFK